MDIKLYRTSLNGMDYSNYRMASSVHVQERSKTAGAAASSYDKLTLHKAQYPSDTEGFAKLLTREAAKEASRPVSQARVEELRTQVSSGAYQPDASLIASRILYYR